MTKSITIVERFACCLYVFIFLVDTLVKGFWCVLVMKRNSLLMISIALSIVGIVALFLITPDVSPRSLKVSGVVKKVSQRGSVSFIRFVPSDLEVISFDGQGIGEGKAVFAGHLQEYKGRVEFVVDQVVSEDAQNG